VRSRGVVAFWRKAYEENVTGMLGMVAYNLLLSIFPFALVVAVHRRPRAALGGALGVAARRPAADLPDGRRHDALGGHPPPPADVDDRRHRRDRRRDLVRLVLLGRDGHRVLPHLPLRVPHLGAAEGFALGMFAVVFLFVAATVIVPTVQALLVRRHATCRSGSPTSKGWSTG
jgi:hypothetical protein